MWTGRDAYNYPTYRLLGTNGIYAVNTPAGYCVDGEMQPL
jgi:hypothetical protein